MYDTGHGRQVVICLDSCCHGPTLPVWHFLLNADSASSCSHFHDSAIHDTRSAAVFMYHITSFCVQNQTDINKLLWLQV